MSRPPNRGKCHIAEHLSFQSGGNVAQNKVINDSAYNQESTESKGESKGKSKGKSNRDKVINLLITNGKLTIPEIASFLKLSVGGIEKIVRQLKQDGILYREGSNKAGKWVINKDTNQ